MGFRLTLSMRLWSLLPVLLWLCACSPTNTETVEESPKKTLLEDGFYGQNTTLEGEKSDTTNIQETAQADSDTDLTASQKSTDEVEIIDDVNSVDATNNAAEQSNGSNKKSDGRIEGEEIVSSIGFSEPEKEAPIEASEQASSYACAASPDDVDSPELSSNDICRRISNRLASVTMESCQTANLMQSQCKSVKQFPILSTEFPPLEGRKPLGRILVIGGTHGDELTSVSIIFRWIAKLNKYHTGLFHWRLAPMLNPDGVLKRAATRTNQNGVDLNRNMPSNDWDENALKYWTEKSGENERRYPGPEAASEPETRWLIGQINTFKPDAIISVHAPYGVVDYDALILNTAPKSLGKLALNLLGTYPGSLGNYAGINLDIPVITLELPHAWEMPSEKESTKIWEDIVSWLRKNVNSQELAENSVSSD